MPTRSVNLTDRLDSFIESGVSSGRFTDASEVVREGLRLLEQREAEDEAKLKWLRGATQDAFAALDRGEGIPLSSVDDIDALMNGAMDDLRAARSAAHG